MTEGDKRALPWVLFMLAVLVLILITGTSRTIAARFRNEAIARGYALYCPTDESFAWKGECK